MIDTNTHIINGVDNGCKDYNDAGKVVLKAKNEGVTTMFVTPHQGVDSKFDADELKLRFKKFSDIFKKYEIDMYLGAEIEYHKDCLVKVFYKKLLTMNNTKFVLMDFTATKDDFYDIPTVVREYKAHGFSIIVAHAEKLGLTDREYLKIKNAGAYFQVDVQSLYDKKYKKTMDYLIEERLVDFVSTSIHSSTNPYLMEKAYKDLLKKTNKDYTDLIFNRNPKNFLILGK